MPKLKVKYVKDDNYAPLYSNGVLGGINIKREVVMHFYQEILEIPRYQAFNVEDEQITGEDVSEREPREEGVLNVNRIIKTGVIMTPQEAHQLYIWLGRHLQTLNNKEQK